MSFCDATGAVDMYQLATLHEASPARFTEEETEFPRIINLLQVLAH